MLFNKILYIETDRQLEKQINDETFRKHSKILGVIQNCSWCIIYTQYRRYMDGGYMIAKHMGKGGKIEIPAFHLTLLCIMPFLRRLRAPETGRMVTWEWVSWGGCLGLKWMWELWWNIRSCDTWKRFPLTNHGVFLLPGLKIVIDFKSFFSKAFARIAIHWENLSMTNFNIKLYELGHWNENQWVEVL